MIIKAGSRVSYTVHGIEGNISKILLNIVSMYNTFDFYYPALYGIQKIVDDLCLKGIERAIEESHPKPKRRRLGTGQTRSRLQTKKTPDCVSKFLNSYFDYLEKMNVQQS